MFRLLPQGSSNEYFYTGLVILLIPVLVLIFTGAINLLGVIASIVIGALYFRNFVSAYVKKEVESQVAKASTDVRKKGRL